MMTELYTACGAPVKRLARFQVLVLCTATLLE